MLSSSTRTGGGLYSVTFSFSEIAVFIDDPIAEYFSRLHPPVLLSEHLWGDTVLVWSICVGAMQKKERDDIGVAIGGSKVKRSGSRCADDWSRGVSTFVVGILSRQP
jgi:hypothetical protein